jgi:DnaJ family protein C protein 13
VSVLSSSSKPEDMAVEVCTHICRCYRVSAQFPDCREAIVEVPAIIKDLCRVLYYKVSVAMGLAGRSIYRVGVGGWVWLVLVGGCD